MAPNTWLFDMTRFNKRKKSSSEQEAPRVWMVWDTNLWWMGRVHTLYLYGGVPGEPYYETHERGLGYRCVHVSVDYEDARRTHAYGVTVVVAQWSLLALLVFVPLIILLTT